VERGRGGGGGGEEREEVPWQSLEGAAREGGSAGEGDDTIGAPKDFLETASQYDDELGVSPWFLILLRIVLVCLTYKSMLNHGLNPSLVRKSLQGLPEVPLEIS